MFHLYGEVRLVWWFLCFEFEALKERVSLAIDDFTLELRLLGADLFEGISCHLNHLTRDRTEPRWWFAFFMAATVLPIEAEYYRWRGDYFALEFI